LLGGVALNLTLAALAQQEVRMRRIAVGGRLVHVINAALPIFKQKIYVWSCTQSGSGWSALETMLITQGDLDGGSKSARSK